MGRHSVWLKGEPPTGYNPQQYAVSDINGVSKCIAEVYLYSLPGPKMCVWMHARTLYQPRENINEVTKLKREGTLDNCDFQALNDSFGGQMELLVEFQGREDKCGETCLEVTA